MNRKVVISGRGCLSPLGFSPEALFSALCDKQCGLSALAENLTDSVNSKRAGQILKFNAREHLGRLNLRSLDRTSALTTTAVKLALADSEFTDEYRAEHEIGLVLGTMFCSAQTISKFDCRGLSLGLNYVSPMDFSNTVINAAAGQAAIWNNLRGVNSTITGGSASGLRAIGYAADLIASGQADVLVAGGVEELCHETLLGFDRADVLCSTEDNRSIPFDEKRSGITLAEGAGFLVLEEYDHAVARNAKIRAFVTGHASAFDAGRGKNEVELENTIARSMQLALSDAQLAEQQISAVSASANGSVILDRSESNAIAAVFKELTGELPVCAIKSALGESLGAAGALQTIALLESMHSERLPGIFGLEQVEGPLTMAKAENQNLQIENGLINAVSLDGHCCSLVVSNGESVQ